MIETKLLCKGDYIKAVNLIIPKVWRDMQLIEMIIIPYKGAGYIELRTIQRERKAPNHIELARGIRIELNVRGLCKWYI